MSVHFGLYVGGRFLGGEWEYGEACWFFLLAFGVTRHEWRAAVVWAGLFCFRGRD